jgi:O-antigen ligase
MYVLNYIYFAIITLVGLSFLFRGQKKVTSPFDRNQELLFNGPELFWTLTFATGLLAFSAPAGLDLMAIHLLTLEIFCLFGLLLVKQKTVITPTVIFYAIYIIWLVIGLLYTPSKFYGFRVILKYLYPFLIMLFASAAVRHEEVFLKAGLWARIVAIASIIVSFSYLEGTFFPGVIWYGTAQTINYIPMCIFSLALFFYMGKKKSNLLLAILFAVPCMVWVFRTSIMGTTLALVTFFFFRYKQKSLPVIACVLLLFIFAIFFIPSIKEKMFVKDSNANVSQLQSGELSKDDIDSNGRFAMWEVLMNKFYTNKAELTGSGTGSVQNYLYSNHVFGGLKVPHNDYVQILCDSGLVGIILYLLAAFLAIIHSFKEYNKRNVSPCIKVCAITAGASMMGVLLTMLTDNVVNYSMATLAYPFGFYGMMLGLKKGE